MQLFNIDFDVLEKLLIRRKLRLPKRMAGITALLSPVKYVWNKFVAFYNGILYDMAHTTQTVFLQAVLNDKYDNILRRIVINDGPDKDAMIVYRDIESKPGPFIYLNAENHPKYIYNNAETADLGPDFIIEIPVAVTYNQEELIALVNKFKLPGKVFIIQTV